MIKPQTLPSDTVTPPGRPGGGRGGRPGGGGRPPRPQRVMAVEGTEQLTPHLVRVHLGGPDFGPFIDEADSDRLNATDKYVKLLIARPELGLIPPYDLDALRLEMPVEKLPAQRTYTVRSIDHVARTIAVDFVIHGDEGVAGPWAANVRPGDLLALSGPGGGYHPSQDASTKFLLLGDDAAIPAIAAALEAMTIDATGTAIIEVDHAVDEIDLRHPTGVTLQWVHRSRSGDAPPIQPGLVLVDAVKTLRPHAGLTEVFAHGERGAMRAIGAVLQDTWGIERRAMSLSAYWATGRAEDRFQAEKREPAGQIFTD